MKQISIYHFLASRKSFVIIALFLGFANGVLAQEVISDLQTNPVLVEADHLRLQNKWKAPHMSGSTNDTLSLPFLDDFSRPPLFGVFADDSLWLMFGGTYVNNTYCINPITTGVATFDGVNFRGEPYNATYPNTYGIADSLCSKPIRMDSVGITEITPASNVYLSFYFQPQGRGNAPEEEDSLFLQFRDRQGRWNIMWSVKGSEITGDTAFKLVMIPIVDTAYLYKGFQFQFKNYATLSGNLDHWNLDYVKLDLNRSVADSVYTDVGFVDMSDRIFQSYRQMPWLHYLADPASANSVSSLTNRITNLSTNTLNLHYNYYVQDEDLNNLYTPFSPPDAPDNILPFSTNGYQDYIPQHTPAFNYTFVQKPVPNDSAVFRILNYVWTTPDDNRWNDTLRYEQKFYTYYAHDDGSAESGYGLNALNGQLAYRFDAVANALPDTLRGVFMYFNRILTDVSQRTFKLTVWGNNGICPNTTECPGSILYQSGDVTPMYFGWMNTPYYYAFNPPLIITSPAFYVGWIQNTADLLNIGLDLHTDSHDKIYFNTTGQWYQSLIAGSLMIRPSFGAEMPANVNVGYEEKKIISNNEELQFYPNPASQKMRIVLNTDDKVYTKESTVTCFDILGQKVFVHPFTGNDVDVSSLSEGFYLLRVSNTSGESMTGKLLIAR